jgi:peptidyl-prolyl cis-trans isomerase SurA
VIAALALWLGLSQADTVDRIAAVVNDEVIALSDIYAVGSAVISEQVAREGEGFRREIEIAWLDQLINRSLITQEVQKLGLDVNEDELERAIASIASDNGLTVPQIRTEIERTGSTWGEYRETLRGQLREMKFQQAVIQPRIVISEAELQDAWRRKVSGLNQPVQADVGALFVSAPLEGADAAVLAAAEAKVAEVKRRLAAGEPFAAVSTALDEGPYGKAGGQMGTFKQGDLVGELDSQAFGLPIGGTSEPLRTPQGWFFVHVFARKATDARPFDEVREQLRFEVMNKRLEQETERWCEAARRQAAVTVLLEPPPKK